MKMCDYYIEATKDEDSYCSYTGNYFMNECPINCENKCPLITNDRHEKDFSDKFTNESEPEIDYDSWCP